MTSRRIGFRKIPNDVFEALIAAKLTGSGYQIVLVVIDKTLGFQKERATITLTHFEKVTGLSRRGVAKAIRKAEDRRIITVWRDSTRKTVYALNPDPLEWLTSEPEFPSRLVNRSSPDLVTRVPQTRELPLPTTTVIKEIFKERVKERGYDKEKDMLSYKGRNEETENERAFQGVSLRGDASRGTYGDRIEAFLRTQGSSSIKAIAEGTGIKYKVVYMNLHKGKGKRFIHFAEVHFWGVIT